MIIKNYTVDEVLSRTSFQFFEDTGCDGCWRVLERDGIRVKQCTQADCMLWVCELHGMRDHESHIMQMRKENVVDFEIDEEDNGDDDSTEESSQSSV